MARISAVPALLPLIVAGALAAPAAAHDCTCRSPNGRVGLGDTVCLKTADGPRLAQCVMDLNITSWKVLKAPCPVADAVPAGPRDDPTTTPIPARRTAGLATPATWTTAAR